MAKSIMQIKDGSCYLCKSLHYNDRQQLTETHHAIPGYGRRKLCEKYGLKVFLCLDHHRIGAAAVHNNKKNMLIVKQAAQRAFETMYSHEKFMEVFGKNYLDDSPTKGEKHHEENSNKLRPV